MSRSFVIASLCLLAGLACAMPLAAQTTMFWNNTDPVNGGDFSDPANWTTGFPGIADTASLQNSNTAPDYNWYPTYLGATPPPNYIARLWVGNQAEGDVPSGGGWLIQSGQILNVQSQSASDASEVAVGIGIDAYASSWSEYDISGGTLNVAPTGGNGVIRIETCNDIIAIMAISGTAIVNVNPPDPGTGWLQLGENYNGTAIVRQSGTSSVTLKSGMILGKSEVVRFFRQKKPFE